VERTLLAFAFRVRRRFSGKRSFFSNYSAMPAVIPMLIIVIFLANKFGFNMMGSFVLGQDAKRRREDREAKRNERRADREEKKESLQRAKNKADAAERFRIRSQAQSLRQSKALGGDDINESSNGDTN
jgi:preprotein translocase subunit SecF